MAQILSGSIDLSKIDKTRITEKDGRKWYNVSIIVNDEADKYGNNASIQQGQTKEEREAKEKPVYLGNAKTVWSSEGKIPKAQEKRSSVDGIDDLPF